ncbi:hypothetical protein [Glaciimonas soli]|uniref:Uncharacterized protein n=1 Tax=Glaciimonas soli TaxID=2590999 RepID=A0A843YTD0_9BURK|nr:hypothetical protein [Glaciimonas soli]MQR01257.1 hypothetical protein [Glaciimonas soli]
MNKTIVAILIAGTSVLAAAGPAEASNKGMHRVGGHGPHGKGSHYVKSYHRNGMHIVGGHGSHHKGGHMVK